MTETVSLEQKVDSVLWLFATSEESEFAKSWCDSNDITVALAISYKLGYVTGISSDGEQLIGDSLDIAVKSLGLDDLYDLLNLIENAKSDTLDE